LPFDQAAADEFRRLKTISSIRNLKTTDLRIAAIVLSRGALLLSADRHFGTIAQATQLRVQDWRSYS
jgi:predicted nucleic acid-binding protein